MIRLIYHQRLMMRPVAACGGTLAGILAGCGGLGDDLDQPRCADLTHHALLDSRGIEEQAAVLGASMIGPMQVFGRLAMMAAAKRAPTPMVAVASFRHDRGRSAAARRWSGRRWWWSS